MMHFLRKPALTEVWRIHLKRSQLEAGRHTVQKIDADWVKNVRGLEGSGLASSDLTTALLDLQATFLHWPLWPWLSNKGYVQLTLQCSYPEGAFYRPGQIDTLAFTGDRELLSSWKFNTCHQIFGCRSLTSCSWASWKSGSGGQRASNCNIYSRVLY